MALQDDAKVDETPMCSELRCKGMYVTRNAPEPNLMVIAGDTAHWWCQRTHYSIGPDKDWVHRTVCTPGRTCYRPPGGPA